MAFQSTCNVEGESKHPPLLWSTTRWTRWTTTLLDYHPVPAPAMDEEAYEQALRDLRLPNRPPPAVLANVLTHPRCRGRGCVECLGVYYVKKKTGRPKGSKDKKRRKTPVRQSGVKYTKKWKTMISSSIGTDILKGAAVSVIWKDFQRDDATGIPMFCRFLYSDEFDIFVHCPVVPLEESGTHDTHGTYTPFKSRGLLRRAVTSLVDLNHEAYTNVKDLFAAIHSVCKNIVHKNILNIRLNMDSEYTPSENLSKLGVHACAIVADIFRARGWIKMPLEALAKTFLPENVHTWQSDKIQEFRRSGYGVTKDNIYDKFVPEIQMAGAFWFRKDVPAVRRLVKTAFDALACP